MDDLALVASLFTPLFAGLVLHGLCIRKGWLAALAVPIDRGARLRGRPLFGANKTWRGVVAVALGSAAGYALQALEPALQPPAFRTLGVLGAGALGLAIGAVAMASELLNSLLKRQLDVAPGAAAGGAGAVFFYVLDQVDFLIGAWLAVWPLVAPTLARVAWSIAFVATLHQAISFFGARLGMRASAR
jgi:CDP-archaeol synthase